MAYSNFIEVFDNINAFSAAINNRPVNSVFANKEIWSEKNSKEFTSTENMAEADILFNNGDGANLDKLTAVNIKTLPVSNDIKNTLIKSVAGGVPVVPLALIGVPKNMLATRKTPKTAKVVNIVYSCAFAYNVRTKDIIKAGAKVASLVKALEARKVRVNLYIADIAKENNQIVGALVNIKKSSAPLNMLRIAYPMINPSMHRRHWFKWLEKVPCAVYSSFYGGYGCPVSIDTNKTAKDMIISKLGKNIILLDGNSMINADVETIANNFFTK